MATGFTSVPTVGLVYSASGAGTALTNSAVATAINKSDIPAIPVANFQGWNTIPWGFHIVAGGVLTSTGSPATLQVSLYADYFQGVPLTLLGSSVALTPAINLTNAFWTAEIWVAPYSNNTVMTNGVFNAGQVTTVPSASVTIGTTSAVTFNPLYPIYFDLVVTRGTAVSADNMTCQQYQIYGLAL